MPYEKFLREKQIDLFGERLSAIKKTVSTVRFYLFSPLFTSESRNNRIRVTSRTKFPDRHVKLLARAVKVESTKEMNS